MRTNISVCCLLIHPGHSPDVPAVCGSSGRQCATACVCVCVLACTPLGVSMLTCIHACIRVLMCVCVCAHMCV